MRLLSVTLLLIVPLLISAQAADPYPKDYFSSPIAPELRLSGSFGELRSNHFHAGIDIKGYIGLPIYSAAPGYIVRIRVDRGGFGNVVYVAHPAGYTTVYAHLNAFAPAIRDYVRREQENRQQFEVDLRPDSTLFVLQAGDPIGKMGTTGYSFGPHLHFEVRDSESGEVLNPLLFSFAVADSRAPRMHLLRLYGLDERHNTLGAENVDMYRSGQAYRLRRDTLYTNHARTGLALKAFDHMDAAPNWNGIYQLDMLVDGQLYYRFEMPSFSFAETRYLNAHVDYQAFRARKSYFNRCFRLPGNHLRNYTHLINDGVLELQPGEVVEINMVAYDVENNQSTLSFPLKRLPSPTAQRTPYFNYELRHDAPNVIENYYARIELPAGTLYQDCYLQYTQQRDDSAGYFSSVHSLRPNLIPFHRPASISIRPDLVPDHLREKAFIARCGSNGRVVNYGGSWKEGRLDTDLWAFGDYAIMVDTVAPTIRPLQFQRNMRGWSRMRFRISDDIRTAGKAGELRYEARIDGEWVLMEYDAKNARLTHYFSEDLSSGTHLFELQLRDAMGNETIWRREIVR